MKIEFLHHYHRRHPLSRRDRLIAFLPRYASHVARFAALREFLIRCRFWPKSSASAPLVSAPLGSCPQWSARPYRAGDAKRGRALAANGAAARGQREAVLFVDTFNRDFRAGKCSRRRGGC